MPAPKEPPSRRVKPVLRSFWATTGEMEIVGAALNEAVERLTNKIAAEELKAPAKQMPAAELTSLRTRRASLERIVRELTA